MSELISIRLECLRIAVAMKLTPRDTLAAARSFEEYLRDVVQREKQGPRPVVELRRGEPRDICGKGFITREELCVSMEVDPQKLDEEARSDMQHAEAREISSGVAAQPEMVRPEKYTPGTVLL